MRWNASSGATYYKVYVSKYPYGSSNMVYQNTNVRSTYLTVPSGKLLTGTKYRWNMQACNSVGCSSVSSTRYFKIALPKPTAPSSMYGKMLVRNGNWALNGYSPYNGRPLTAWYNNTSDGDQRWDLLAPGSNGGNKGWMIRRKGTNYCVNAHYLYQQAPVNLWTCNGGDADQQFDMNTVGVYKMFKRKGTNYCLNMYAPRNYSRVNLYSCNTADADQKFQLK